MMFEHWDLKSDEAYMRDAITAWYAEGSNFNPEDPSNALRYTQVGPTFVYVLNDSLHYLVDQTLSNNLTYFSFANSQYFVHVYNMHPSDAMETIG